MNPAAVYPVPTTSAGAIYVLLALLTVGLPIYVLVFRPIRDERTWGLAEIVAMAVLFILALPLAAQWLGVGHEFSLLELSVAAVVQNLLLAGLSAYVVITRYRLPATSLGLRAPGWRGLLAVGGVAAAVAVVLGTAGERVAVYLIGLVTGPQQAALMAAREHLDDPLLPVLGTLAGVLPVTWLLVLLCVVVPIGEEIFFRGFVYGGLRVRWGAPLALLASSTFFAAVHLQIVHGFPIFLLGVVFAVAYHRTGSLVPAIVAHGVNNLIAVLSLWQGWGM
ncbi:MAG: CPBP family intramembrane glutamic endopeptidase [Armatimonadota bacterium]|nr:CPBP family intramembrane glutamic endopeptidase [Armatimonadota bacterium]